MTAASAKPNPLDVVEDEARRCGLKPSASAARWFLLGYLIGREWDKSSLQDAAKLRAFVGMYLNAGRKRKAA